MEYAIHRISLDIKSERSQATIRVKRGETKRKLYITLREGGVPYQIADDCTAVFSAIKPDKTSLYNQCKIENNTIIYTFTEQTTPVVGTMDCEIILYDTKGEVITPPHIAFIIEPGSFNGDEVASTPEATALEGLIERAKGAAEQAEGITTELYNHMANAFKCNKGGAVVSIDDAAPIEHTINCRVDSKNLWNMGAFSNTDLLTFEDGIVTVKGSNYACTSETKLKQACPTLKVGDVVTLSISTTGRPLIYLVGANVKVDQGTTLTITDAMLDSYVALYGAYEQDADYAESHTVNWIQLERGEEVTDYAPYVDVSTVSVRRCGKNLAYPNYRTAKIGGYTYAPNKDGTVTISGAATTISEHIIPLALKDEEGNTIPVTLKADTNYTLTIRKNGVKTTGIGTKVLFADGTIKWGFDRKASQERELQLVYLQFTPAVGDTEHCGTYSVQLEHGDVATEYEPYIGEAYEPDSDGTVEGITSLYPNMTIYTDTENTLVTCEYSRDSNRVYKELYDYLEGGGLTGPAARIADVTILANAWVGTASPYSQVVTVDTVTPNTQVDLTPSAAQLAIFHNKDLAFVTENDDGVVTVYAIGQKPTNDYTIQATLTEVMI